MNDEKWLDVDGHKVAYRDLWREIAKLKTRNGNKAIVDLEREQTSALKSRLHLAKYST
jgi:hypothetical protein